jgi:ABC-type branched-subunit amino acid transport system ATPase component
MSQSKSEAKSMQKEESYFKATGIVKTFGGLVALDHVNISFEKGKITGLIGPNGSGKSTFFNVVTGFLKKDEGSVSFQGKDMTQKIPEEIIKMGVARTWQDLRIFENLTVLENVMVAIRPEGGENVLRPMFQPWKEKRENEHTRQKALEILASVGLDAIINDIAGTIAYPEQKLLSFARLLATEAELWLLDEPASGLDIKAASQEFVPLIRKMIKEKNRTACIVEHVIEVVEEICDWIYFLDQGKVIAQGNKEDILGNSSLAEIYFGR